MVPENRDNKAINKNEVVVTEMKYGCSVLYVNRKKNVLEYSGEEKLGTDTSEEQVVQNG